jgi:hypothetical protein
MQNDVHEIKLTPTIVDMVVVYVCETGHRIETDRIETVLVCWHRPWWTTVECGRSLRIVLQADADHR